MRFASVFPCFRPVPPRRVSAPLFTPAGRCSAAFRTCLLAAAFVPGVASAQLPGAQDLTFKSSLTGVTIFSVVAERSGINEGIITGGDLTGLTVENYVGTSVLDFTSPEFGNLSRIVYTIVPEALPNLPIYDQKLLLGGLFGKTKVNKVISPAQNITRISLDGTIDTTFNPGHGADNYVTAILPQADGSMFVGGEFLFFNQQSFPRIVKLTATGAIDPGFGSVAVTDGVFALAAQIDPTTGLTNGQVLLGGSYSSIGGSNYTKLARIDQAGNLDASFKPVIDDRVLAIAVQPDGKIVIGGQFTTVNGASVGHLARLNQDGSLDTTFHASVGVVPTGTNEPVAVYVLRLLPDGRLLVGGNFYAVDGATRFYLGRIESDGSLDAAFDPGDVITNSVQSLAVQTDNNVLVGETISKKINNVFPPSLIRLYGDVDEGTLSIVGLEVAHAKARARPGGGGQNGLFTLFREAGDLSVPLTVYFSLDGTAQTGVAYLAPPNHVGGQVYSATFPANETHLKVKVKPLVHNATDAPESVVLSLLPSQSGTDFYATAGEPQVGTVEVYNTQ